jgi:hypothetical protein
LHCQKIFPSFSDCKEDRSSCEIINYGRDRWPVREDHKISIKKFRLSSHTATCWNLGVERSKHSGAGAFFVSRHDNLVSLIDHEISLSALRNRCSIAGDTLQPQIALQRLLLLKCRLLHYFNTLQLPRMIYVHGKHIC